MPAITQLSPNFLGGVSKQIDSKKLPGQVRDAINAFPDPTFGMLKRNGMQFIRTVKKLNGNDFTQEELEDAAWFFIQRGDAEAYFGCIKENRIYVWNTITGNPCQVFSAGTAYLTGTSPEDYHFRSIQDVTIVTNRTVAPELIDAPTDFKAGRVGTIVLKTVEYSAVYSVNIDGITTEVETRNADVFDESGTDEKLNADEILGALAAKIEVAHPSMTVRTYSTSIELLQDTPFTLKCKGGVNGQAIECYQDEVANVSKLPPESYNGRLVKVLNSGADEDDYYLEYKDGVWVEARSPEVSEGLVSTTMPHELVNTAPDTFIFQPINWTKRLVGDDLTNPPPSIFKYNTASDTYESPGHPIESTFFYNNRFGLISKDNIIMSQVDDPYNLFAASARVIADSDPVDINATSVRPVKLYDVLPSAQGLLVFGRRQQFLMFASDSGPITPNSAVIRGISNYEAETDIAPVENGVTAAFVSKVPGYAKLLTLQPQGTEAPPTVLELSKVVTEWLPRSVTNLVSSPQNSFLALTSRNTPDVYLYRYFNNGREDLFQSWVRWKLPGHVQASFIVNDMFYFVTTQADQYTLSVINVNDIPGGIQMANNVTANPLLDLYQRPTSVTYDSGTNKTKMYVGYNHIEDQTPIMVFAMPPGEERQARTLTDLVSRFNVGPKTPETDADPGYWKEVDAGTDSTGSYFEVDGNFTEYTDNIVLGYKYDFDVELPKFYYTTNAEGTRTDYTANLTVSRIKVAVGKTGAVTFKLQAKGSEEWVDIEHVTDANYYEADTSPIEEERVFEVPIHQRNENFIMKITSDLPFPVSLVSMMWEGMYTPRYFRRK